MTRQGASKPSWPRPLETENSGKAAGEAFELSFPSWFDDLDATAAAKVSGADYSTRDPGPTLAAKANAQ